MYPWMRFGQEVKGYQLELKLPSNWQNKTTGFAMCAAFRSKYPYVFIDVGLKITFSKVVNNQSVNMPLSSPDPELPSTDIRIGYISFNLLRRSCEGVIRADLMDIATQLFLTFDTYPYDEVESCAAHLVYKEDIVDSEATAFSSQLPFSSDLQQEKDPNFAASTKVRCRKVHGSDIFLHLNGHGPFE